MRVFLTGGTGVIGRGLVRRLIERGDRPVVLSRQAGRARLNRALKGADVIQGDPTVAGGWETAVDGCDAVINLVGHNIFAQRWNDEVKRALRDSRVHATENVVAAIAKASRRPGVLVQASAVGFYGPHGDEELTESSPPGDDFMARLCVDWESAAQAVEGLDARLATIRTGVVLAKNEGMLGALTPVFRWVLFGAAPVGGGGRSFAPGQGRQWLSWIHIDDIVGIFLLGLDHPEARGPINGTSPRPERFVDFGRALAKAVHRWFMPFGPPDVVMNVVLGEVAQVVTTGQRALPAKASALGYEFRFPEVEAALRDLFAAEARHADRTPSAAAR